MNVITPGALALTLALATGPAHADLVRVPSQKSVTETADALVAAVEGAGATLFARVDHGKGAASVGLEMPEAQLIVFGNPQLGTPAMQDAIEAGLVLPLRVLVHDDGQGGSVLVYEEPGKRLEEVGGDDDADYVSKMEAALRKLTAAASE